MKIDQIMAVSPIDGRYAEKVTELQPIWSEYGLHHHRLLVEVRWLQCLAQQKLMTLSSSDNAFLNHTLDTFSEKNALAIQQIEKQTKHDVKAVEYFLKQKCKQKKSLLSLLEFIHFGCTSDDINNLAYALMIKQTRNNHLLPQLKIIISQLQTAAHRYADLPMLSRTHGQPATPTTLGKEFANFAARLKTQYEQLKFIKIQGKFNGATGNYSAAAFAYPDMNWEKINKHFVEKLGLAWNAYTTQIEPHDYIAELSHCLIRINNIFTDFARNMWGYISLGYFKQTVHVNQIGSSTMPHKVNPIDFENAEGNFGVANALFEFFANKLPLSRFQRDLSDSTVMRNLGVAFAHTLIADQSLLKGLKTLQPNKKYLQDELENHWELLAEALQTLMRRHGIKNAYEKLKKLTHGKSITKTALHQWVDSLKLPLEEKQRFKQLTPAQYIGQAKTLAKKI